MESAFLLLDANFDEGAGTLRYVTNHMGVSRRQRGQAEKLAPPGK